MPSWVPGHGEVIVGSGVVELVCAAGLVAPSTRRVAGLASAALLVAVSTGNLKTAVDAVRRGGPVFRAAALARLPLQVPMIRTAWRAWQG
jgi:uncharacterized membrane protein